MRNDCQIEIIHKNSNLPPYTRHKLKQINTFAAILKHVIIQATCHKPSRKGENTYIRLKLMASYGIYNYLLFWGAAIFNKFTKKICTTFLIGTFKILFTYLTQNYYHIPIKRIRIFLIKTIRLSFVKNFPMSNNFLNKLTFLSCHCN